ncbi:MAG: TIGR03984 family CRISPR-associated protein [Planctomycetales bacterium]|nr:TIGR03984 family CRISPR-associated protein [Planctomycetales bacterium]
MSGTLFVYTDHGQSLPETLAAFAKTLPASGAVALLYSPANCMFARLASDSSLTDGEGNLVNLARVYEARVFHDGAELRWLNDPGPDQAHRTAVLSDNAMTIGPTAAPLAFIDTLPQTYLLWGEGWSGNNRLPSAWSRLATARIGKLDVPLAGVSANNRVLLHAVEYLAEYEDGNVGVAEERLLRLEVNRG